MTTSLKDIDPNKEISKEKYKKAIEPLLIELQTLHRKIFEAGIPVVLVLDGWEGAGKGDCLSRLLSRMDPRGTRVHPIFPANEEEALRPFFWRFWMRLPSRGQVAVFEQSWSYQLLTARAEGTLKNRLWLQGLEEANHFERLLAEDGTLIIKFWLHISRKEQKRRFKKWRADPAFAFRVTKEAKRQNKRYDQYLEAADEMLRMTHSPSAPWTVVEAGDRRYRRLQVVKHTVKALKAALNARKKKRAPAQSSKAAPQRITAGPNPLDQLNLAVKLDRKEYRECMGELQEKLFTLQHLCYLKRMPVIIVFEGADAGGKGGAIRRLVSSLDPRGYTVIPVAAPEGEEKTHHYLWRFWRSIPKAGHWAITDRSWYGRVLVERVEGFCRPEVWGRAYHEIREFESQLRDAGAVVVKFWLHIGKDEQLKRFKERARVAHKKHKITDEDWRNREKWDLYSDAIADLVFETGTPDLPWTLVEGNDKLWARVKVLKTVADAVEKGLETASEDQANRIYP